MEELNLCTTTTVCPDGHSKLYGIAFDGCFFYFTAPQECGIYKFKRDFSMSGHIKADKPYTCICYDYKENCFWVTEKKHNDTIYKLDCNMKEIGQLRVTNSQRACSSLIGLSYDCEKDTLLAAYKEHIVQVSKESGRACIVREACEEFYISVLSIAPYYLIVGQDKKGQRLQVFTRDGHTVKSFCVPALYSIKDVLFYPCNHRCRGELEFILLAAKVDCSRNTLIKIKICDMAPCGCNYIVCSTRCGEHDEEEQCICDVIESVALAEASLAHILNAEGEKLQKAVKVANNVDELLAVNKSVAKTIINITQLEHQLYLKLDALNDLCKKPIHNYKESN